MKNAKKSLGILMAALLIISCMPLAFAATSATITFSNDAVEIVGSGATADGTAVKITKAGTYTVSGSCSSGSIVVKKGTTGVTIILNGLALSAHATAAITANKGSEVTIQAAAGTVNTLSDDKFNNDDVYTDESMYPDIENAVIKAKDGAKLTLSGTGTLNVISNGKNGIKGGSDLYADDGVTIESEAFIVVQDLTLNMSANVNDGLKSDKQLDILSGRVNVSAVDDGIKSDYVLNIGSSSSAGPIITISKSNEGIEGATINVYSGNVTVNATDDGINAANSDLSSYTFSYNQYGGTVYVNVSNGDGVDSNGNILLQGGYLEVYSPSSGDGDPIDADGSISLAGTTVLAVGNNMMNQPYVSAGAAYVTFNSRNMLSANSSFSITDSNGNVLANGKAVRSASYVVFSSPNLISGSSYNVVSGGKTAASSTATTASQGGGFFPGGGGFIPGGNGENGNSGSGFSILSAIRSFFERIINFFKNLFKI